MVTLFKLHQKLPQMKSLNHIMLNSGCRFRNLENQDELESNTAIFSFHSVKLVFYPIGQHYSHEHDTETMTAKKSSFLNIPVIKYARTKDKTQFSFTVNAIQNNTVGAILG